MARTTLNDAGVSAGLLSVVVPGNSNNDEIILVNESRSAVDAVITLGTDVANLRVESFNDEGITVRTASDGNVKLDRQSYVILVVDKTGPTSGAVTIAAGGVKSTHGTSSVSGDHIILAQEANVVIT